MSKALGKENIDELLALSQAIKRESECMFVSLIDISILVARCFWLTDYD